MLTALLTLEQLDKIREMTRDPLDMIASVIPYLQLQAAVRKTLH